MSEAVVDLFDRVADRYDTVLPFFSEFGRLCVEILPTPRPGDRLLDVGAGRGALAVAASAKGFAVTATDAAPGMVSRLTADHPELDAHVMDAAHLEFDDDTFDVVTAGFVMHLLEDPAAALREAKRVLKPGGLIAFTTLGRVPDGFEVRRQEFHDRLIADLESRDQILLRRYAWLYRGRAG